MICPRCRKEVPEGTKACPQCSFTFQEGESYQGEDAIGYSDKINEPIYKKRTMQGKRSFVVTGYLLSTVFLIGTPVIAAVTGDMNLVTGIIVGIAFSFFFAYFATLQLKALRNDRTWDGVVEGRDIEVRAGKKGGEFHKLLVRAEGSDTAHWYTFNQGHLITHYYHEGDKVRHHKGFNFFEKYDKSHDQDIICINCGKYTNSNEDYCDHCNLPLLK